MPSAEGSASGVEAICSVPVQVYDDDLAGVYEVGDVLTGEKARLALKRYPDYFVRGRKR